MYTERAGAWMTLRTQTVRGVAWAAGARLGNQFAQFVVSAILSRLLFPDDFGLIGMIAVFTGFAALFSEFGLGSALIQRREITDDHINSIFWLNLLIGAGITLIFWAASGPIARFYSNPHLVSLTRALAFSFSIAATAIVPRALLQKRMDFRNVARVDILSTIMAGATAVFLALAGAGVWSLVVQTLLGNVVAVPLLWRAARWRPRVRYSAKAIRELVGFAANLSGYNVINYWARNSDNLFVGKVIGSSALGIYARAYSLMLLPISQVTSVVGTVMFPALSSIQEDRPRVRRIYLRAMGVIALITFPMMTGLFVVAKPFVLAVYGQRWAGVIPILEIMCPIGLLQSMMNPVGWLYTSQGRTDWMFRWGVAGSGTLIVAIAIGAYFRTTESIAISYLIANVVLFYPCLAIPGRLVELRVVDVCRAVGGAMLCALAMGIVVWCVGRLLPQGLSAWITLSVEIAVGVLAYVLLVVRSDVAAYHDLRSLVHDRRSQVALDAEPVTP